jgi:hypothetical protein
MVEEGSKQKGTATITYGTVLCPYYFYGTEAWDVQVKAAGSVSDSSS